MTWSPARWAGNEKALAPFTDDIDDLPPASRAAARLEGALRRAIVDVWRQTAQVVDGAALEAAAARASELDLDRLLLPQFQDSLMEQVLVPRLAAAYLQGADVAGADLRAHGVLVRPRKQLAVDLAAVNPEAVRWAQQHAAELIRQGIRPGQREAIRELIVAANEEGIAPRDVARRVYDLIGLRPDQSRAVTRFRQRLREQGVPAADVRRRAARYADAQRRRRALTIARTELVASVNAGQFALWTQAVRAGAIRGRHAMKVWIVTDDERLEMRCEALGEQEPVPLNEPFVNGIMHPPLHPNCRCAMGLVFVEQRDAARPTSGEVLTDAEKDAVRRYTFGGGWQQINEALRDGQALSSTQQQLVALLDSAIAKAPPLPEGTILFRGVNFGRQGMPSADALVGLSAAEREALVRSSIADWAEERFKPGETFQLGGFQSTSRFVQPALDASLSRNSPGIVFEINARQGLDLKDLAASAVDDESEVLLSRFTTYRVDRVTRQMVYENAVGHEVQRTVVHVTQIVDRAREADVAGDIFGTPPLPFDGEVRDIIKRAPGFWERFDFFRDDVLSRGHPTDGDLQQAVKMIIGQVGGRSNAINVELDAQDLIARNAAGTYIESTNTIRLAPETTRAFRAFFRGGRRLARNDRDSLASVLVVVHEGLHSRALGNYISSADVFLEEGLVESRARRFTMGLVFGGRDRPLRPGFTRNLGAYEDYVQEVTWFERTFGPRVTRELWEGQRDRTNPVRMYLSSWLPGAVARSSSPWVKAHADEILRAGREATPWGYSSALQMGAFRMLADKTTKESTMENIFKAIGWVK